MNIDKNNQEKKTQLQNKTNQFINKSHFKNLLKNYSKQYQEPIMIEEIDQKKDKYYINSLKKEMKKLKIRIEKKEKEIENDIRKSEEFLILPMKEKIILKSQEISLRKNKIISLEEKIEVNQKQIQEEFDKEKNDIIDSINSIRKENAIFFESKIEFYSKGNNEIKQLKKKLYMYMNFLKLRILNSNNNSISNKNITIGNDSKEKEGYFINREKYCIRNFDLKLNEIKNINNNMNMNNYYEGKFYQAKKFWGKFIDCFIADNNNNEVISLK